MARSRNILVVACAAVIVVGITVVSLLPKFSDSALSDVNVSSNNVAIRGYDTVAYFTEDNAVKGREEFAYSWADALWFFSTAENQELFARNPEQFAPQYGGYCALGIADGYIANIDPEAWTIVEGRLYLNRNKELMKKWRTDQPARIEEAERNWADNRANLKNAWTENE